MKIVLNGVGQNMNALDLVGLFDYTGEKLSSTFAKFFDDANNYTKFLGTGLEYDLDTVPGTVIPTAGTITGALVVESGVRLQTYSDTSISAIDFYNFAVGNDVVGFYAAVLSGKDIIVGSDFSDTLIAGDGNDRMSGRSGNDRMFGGNDRDRMSGDGGDDVMRGENGADRMDGGDGADVLIGGRGSDQFYFTSALGTGVDTVKDFNPARDALCLDDAVFAEIGTAGSSMNAGSFVTTAAIGSAVLDANDRIIYDTSTGNLYYDDDGSGGNGAVRFAQLTNLATLSATDILVV
ncbi:MAG: hypothetical protein KDK75_09555 [Alphaproteobacteria bacterium]|nr:hypothetical protein [Alphaproteobacteria bacterium]